MRFFQFKGRAARGEFILHYLAESFLYVVFIVLAAFLKSRPGTPAWFSGALGLMVIVGFVVIIADSVSVTIRRLHDLDRPGSHWWLLFVPLYNIYLEFVLWFKRGTDGPNRFDIQDGSDEREPVPKRMSGEYVCGRCGGAVSRGEPFCRHCGETLE